MCAAVCHLPCAKKANKAAKKTNGAWWCPQCTVSIQTAETTESVKLGMELKRRNDFFSALTIQSNFMMWTERNRFLKFKGGLIFLQAVIRKVRQQRAFSNALTSHYRPLKINPIDYNGGKGAVHKRRCGNPALTLLTLAKFTYWSLPRSLSHSSTLL